MKKDFKKWLLDEHQMAPDALAEKSNAEQGQMLAGYMDYVAGFLEDARKADVQNADEIKSLIKDRDEAQEKANTALRKAIVEQGLVMQKLAVASTQGKGLDKLEAKFDLLAKTSEEAKASASKEKHGGWLTKSEVNALRLKTAVTAGSVTDNTDSYRLETIGQLAHRMLTLYDLFPKIPVPENSNGTVRYTDWDDATKVRAAAMIAEEGTFPESTAAWQEYSQTLKKVGDTIPVTYESTQDRARFVAELDEFLRTNVDLVIDSQLYDGDGTGNNLTGIYTSANTFTPVASGITDANIFDLIRKVRTTLSQGKRSKYMANVVFMNATDIDAMLLKKDANNNYVRPDFFQLGDGTNVYVVSGVMIIETNVVTANTMLMGDSRFARIYEDPRGYEVLMGYSGTDFVEDLMTMKARRRLLMLVREVDKDAWLKVTSISAALTTLAL